MIKAKIGFIVYGVHKDGLKDPMGRPFIDAQLVTLAKKALLNAGLELVEHKVVIASKKEARECLNRFKKMEDVDAIVLFSGTWVWAAHLTGALRDFSGTGKGIVLWTHPGSQGWRPVGGLVMHGALKEIGLAHRFVYGSHEVPKDVARIVSYCLNLEILRTSGCRIDELRAIGGGAKSAWWNQLKADILGCPINTADVTDAGCLGAAMLACAADTQISVRELARRWVRTTTTFQPRAQYGPFYGQKLAAYKELYHTLKQFYKSAACLKVVQPE